MPYAMNQGIRIRYEVEGAGPALVLQHGLLGCGEMWHDYGYVDALKGKHQLIIIDARGHGRSDKPHDPSAYDLPLRVGDVTAVLDHCGIRDADYFGYSMGGRIGFGLAKCAPSRLRSLIVGAAHAFFANMQPWRDRMPGEQAVFRATVEKAFGQHMTRGLQAALATSDLKALIASMQDYTSVADVLPTISAPCLLFVGEADPCLAEMRECLPDLANTTFFTMPGCDHIATMARSDLVLPHVQAFLAKVHGTDRAKPAISASR